MAAKRNIAKSSAPKILHIPSIVVGVVVGCLVTLGMYQYGDRVLGDQPVDMSIYPDINSAFPNTQFEFYDTLKTDYSKPTDKSQVTELALVDDPVPATTSSPKTEPAVPDDPVEPKITGYILQTGSFADTVRADERRARLILNGFEAYTTEIQSSTGQAMIRVIVGPYATEVEGRRAKNALAALEIESILLAMRQGIN